MMASLRRGLGISGMLCVACAAGCVDSNRGFLRDHFANHFVCPPAGVAIVEQHGRAYQPPPPPDDIAKDPRRLAFWQHQVADLSTRMAHRTYYVVSGCGRQITYVCVDTYYGNAVPRPECSDTSPGELDPDLHAPGDQ